MSDQHQAGGSETCGDPYPQSYTSGTEVQMRLCERDKDHTGEHRWHDYGWGPAPEPGGSGAESTEWDFGKIVLNPQGALLEIQNRTRLTHQLSAECVERLHDQERLRAALETARTLIARLVALGHDDGSAPDNAWRQAFNDAEAWLRDH